MSISTDLAIARRKVENLNTERADKALDTLAGAVLRVFARLSNQDLTIAQLSRRLAAFEGSQSPAAKPPASAVSGAARNRHQQPVPPGYGSNGCQAPARPRLTGTKPAGPLQHREDLQDWRD
jgi:hypothetical protein